MQNDTVRTRVTEVSSVHGEVLALVRRLVVAALLAGVGYSMLSTASEGRCLGGIRADSQLIDGFGDATEAAPRCVTLTLHPNPVVYLALALVVVWAVSRATQPGLDEVSAVRELRRAVAAAILLAALAVGLTMSSYSSIPPIGGTGPAPLPSRDGSSSTSPSRR